MLDELGQTKLPDDFAYSETALVGVFDILGFGGIMNGQVNLIEWGAKVATLVDIIAGCGEQKTRFEYSGRATTANPEVILASDTYVAYTVSREPQDLMQFLWNTISMMFYSLHYEMPVRGALSTGKLLVSKRRKLYLGPAIIEAFDCEKRQEWAGACLCPSLYDHIARENLEEALFPLVVRYDIPVDQHDKVAGLALNWVADFYNWMSPEVLASHFPETGVEGMAKQSALRKQKNTADFLGHVSDIKYRLGPQGGPKNRKMVLEKDPQGRRYIRFVLDEE